MRVSVRLGSNECVTRQMRVSWQACIQELISCCSVQFNISNDFMFRVRERPKKLKKFNVDLIKNEICCVSIPIKARYSPIENRTRIEAFINRYQQMRFSIHINRYQQIRFSIHDLFSIGTLILPSIDTIDIINRYYIYQQMRFSIHVLFSIGTVILPSIDTIDINR